MSEQEKKTGRRRKPSETEAPAPSREATEKGKKLEKDMDELIDEIDEVLEENAEEFVKNYVQRGGE